LSFNPLKHIDPYGTILLPLLLLLVTRGGLVFGYAKPVPINPYNFKDVKRDTGLSAAAGPASNFIIAIIFSILIRFMVNLPYHPQTLSGSVLEFLFHSFIMIVFFNLLLACFNLIPFPPLDGSKILGIVLPDHIYYPFMRWERKGMMIFMGAILLSYLFGWNLIGRIIIPPISLLMRILTGVSFF